MPEQSATPTQSPRTTPHNSAPTKRHRLSVAELATGQQPFPTNEPSITRPQVRRSPSPSRFGHAAIEDLRHFCKLSEAAVCQTVNKSQALHSSICKIKGPVSDQSKLSKCYQTPTNFSNVHTRSDISAPGKMQYIPSSPSQTRGRLSNKTNPPSMINWRTCL